MAEQRPLDLETYFGGIKDPRVERTKQHKLLNIIIIAICGVICGAEGWVNIEEFGKEKEAWLKTLLELPNGIPSHDTFGRVFAHLDPVKFEACFFEWVQSLTESVEGVIAIDGKTLRRSHDKTNGKDYAVSRAKPATGRNNNVRIRRSIIAGLGGLSPGMVGSVICIARTSASSNPVCWVATNSSKLPIPSCQIGSDPFSFFYSDLELDRAVACSLPIAPVPD